MKLRSIRQFYVQPKAFHSIGFHHQGQYYLRMTLIQLNHQNQHIHARPTIQLAHPDPNQPYLSSDHNYYYSQLFEIQFNDETVHLKHGCLFQMEYLAETNLTYLELQLIKKEESLVQQGLFTIVGRNRLYINVNLVQDNSLSSYQKVSFTTPQYYSSLYIFIEHVKISTKLGTQQNQPSHPNKTQQQTTPIQSDRKIIAQDDNKLYSTVFKGLTNEQIYTLLVVAPIIQYNKVKSLYHKLLTILAMYLKQNQDNTIEIMPKSLDYILVEDWKNNPAKLLSKYKVDSYNQLYMSLYMESQLIGKSIKFVWDKCIQLILKMRPAILIKYVQQSQQLNAKLSIDNFEVLEKDAIGIKWSQLIQIHKTRRDKVLNKVRFYFWDMKIHPMIVASRRIIQQYKMVNGIMHLTIPPSQILTIFIHGYKGNEFDMSRIKFHLFTYSNSNFYVVQGLQRIMDEDIETISLTAATQILLYLASKPNIKRINIVGFSLGGIIARGALKHLKEYKSKFNLLITFATPHLGISEVSNCLVKAGISYINKIAKVKNMKELSQDSIKGSKSCLLKLSQCESLSWFKHTVVVGAEDDSYVPIHSSLIDYNGQSNDLKKMQENILNKSRVIHRLNIWFDIKEGLIQWLLGKKSHVSFLENDPFLHYFFGRYWKLL